MKAIRLGILIGALFLALGNASTARACPSCQVAIEATTGSKEKQREEAKNNDVLREARAYNYSIYLMVAMPYLLLGSVGFLIYRGVKKNQEWKRLHDEQL